jgi:periplasmic divalent cation tolerance protein
MDLIVVLCTFPDVEVARSIAAKLVEEEMAACVNLSSGTESIYRWQGKVESAHEVLGLIKTTRPVYEALESRLKELHPYEVPEIVALATEQALAAYAKWVSESVVSPTLK